MDNKNKAQAKKEYDACSLAVYLANKCYHRDHKSKEAAESRYDGTIKQDTLRSVLLSETTIVNESTSFIGYLKVCAKIFKIAFLDKKVNRSFPILRGTFWVE